MGSRKSSLPCRILRTCPPKSPQASLKKGGNPLPSSFPEEGSKPSPLKLPSSPPRKEQTHLRALLEGLGIKPRKIKTLRYAPQAVDPVDFLKGSKAGFLGGLDQGSAGPFPRRGLNHTRGEQTQNSFSSGG